MKIFKKAMALFLAMLMILAVAPVSAFADEANDTKITVTFDANGGTCETDALIYSIGAEFGYLPACEAREGYEFLGWYTEDGELISETALVAFNEDTTLYAHWEDLNATELNPFAFIGKFFEAIGNILRLVVQFLENMFSGTGNDALEQIK